MTTFRPSTCDCVIENYLEPEERLVLACKLHVNSKSKDVLAHNKSFTESFILSCEQEKQRIRAL